MLLQAVEKHLRTTRTSPTRFGRDAVGDPKFVFDLRNGRVPRKLDEADRRRLARYFGVAEAVLGGPAEAEGRPALTPVPVLNLGAAAGHGAFGGEETPVSHVAEALSLGVR